MKNSAVPTHSATTAASRWRPWLVARMYSQPATLTHSGHGYSGIENASRGRCACRRSNTTARHCAMNWNMIWMTISVAIKSSSDSRQASAEVAPTNSSDTVGKRPRGCSRANTRKNCPSAAAA